MLKLEYKDTNSAKFIAMCFGFMAVITISVVPILSAFSGLICAVTATCGFRGGINSYQYLLSAIIFFSFALAAVWKIH